MKRLSFSTTLATQLAYGFLAIGSVSAAAQDAAATYKTKCAMCHGPDGKLGKMGTKDFASPEIQGLSEATETITKGTPPRMPAYEGKLKETEIKDLVAHVRRLGRGGRPSKERPDTALSSAPHG